MRVPKVRSLLAVGVCLLGLAGCATSAAQQPSAQVELLRNWALCRCLAKSAVSEQAGDDATKSAAAYLEAGSSNIETYESLERLVDTRLKEHRSGSVDASYNTMKCIDLFRSSELASMAQEATKVTRPAAH